MKLIMVIGFLVFSTAALGQSDPSALTFVDSSAPAKSEPAAASAAPSDADVGSGHYVKKHRPVNSGKKRRVPANESAQKDNSAPPAPAPELQNAQVAPLPGLSSTQTFNNDSAPAPAPVEEQEKNATFGSKMRDMFLGGDVEVIDKYRSFLDSDDVRKNVFEFTLATSYFYNQSSSPYFFRNYIDSGPAAEIGLDMWLTPFLGIDADYRTALLSQLRDSPTSDTFIDVNQSWFDLGLKFRRFYGMSVNASSLTLGIRYSEYSLLAPAGAQTRLKQFTQGPELTLDASIPSSRNFSWTFGLTLAPYLTHTEAEAATDLRSGTSNRTISYGASFGGEYRMTRQTRVFFKLSSQVFRSAFTGTAASADPVTGTTPSNVPVNNAFYTFDLGIRLGK